MGFWDSVGNAAKGAINSLEEHNAEVKELANRYQREDFDFLKEKFKFGSATQKIAACQVLKERGYDGSDLRD